MSEVDPRLLPKILYIEDSEESRFLVRRLLASRYVFLETSDPLDGLQIAEETRPDLVLLDYNLPHMKGSEVATLLRKSLPEIPLVIVSAETSEGARERALAAGAVGFIGKPIDVDTFSEQIDQFLGGKRDKLERAEHYLQIYQEELVERLEENVRHLTKTLEHNEYLLKQNKHILDMLQRKQKLLEAGLRVGQAVTSILDINALLMSTVDIICTEFNLHYSGIFLLSDDRKWADLHAGYGEAGAEMLRENYRLPVDKTSMIGRCIIERKARITLDVGEERVRFKNPHLPNTRSEIALPLLAKSRVLGALTVQSDELNAFVEEDVNALQSMANQVAIAISNAQLLKELEQANAELVRTKTFEAIATATGEAIHWVGNKAAPVPGSVRRIREDLSNLLALFSLLRQPGHPETLDELAEGLFNEARENGMQVDELASELQAYSPKRLQASLSVESMLEDLQIVDHSAQTILNIKEDMIGPARQRHPTPFSLRDMLSTLAIDMGLPKGVIELALSNDLPDAFGDARQVEQVFNNLVKNAWEAMGGAPKSKIWIRARIDDDPRLALVTVTDNGPGIPPELQERIWVSFFTTKGDRGGTGLGLSACMQIVDQNAGKIWLESAVGKGTTFFVQLPVAPIQNSKEDLHDNDFVGR